MGVYEGGAYAQATTGGGGGGTDDHTALTNLAWVGSGHTGLANSLASFNGTGVAANLTPGAGVVTFLATPSSANLAAAVTDETGTGALVFGTSPTIATPTLTLKQGTTPTAEGDVQWDATANRIVVGNGATTTTFYPGNSGLLYLLEAWRTSSPYSTDTASASLVATDDTATRIDVSVIPKGGGAFSLQRADGTATGGDLRGANSVDLQTSRSASTQVASGQYSLVIGNGNTASGLLSLAHGLNNVASGQYSVAFGSDSTINGTLSSGFGNRVHSQGRKGFFGLSNGFESTTGDAQTWYSVYRNRTTDATPTALTADSSTGTANANLLASMVANSAMAFTVRLIAKQTGSANVGDWEFKFAAVRNSTGTPAIKSGMTVVEYANDFGLTVSSSWIQVSATANAIYVQVTGVAATNIQWVAKVEAVEVIY